jgi:hypothetical protein
MGGYRAERNAILKFIADNHIDHVVFLTTDDHQVRINELGYFATPGDQTSYTRVPGCFEILAGPIGADGPQNITDHSFANIKSIADSFASQQRALGLDPIGFDPAFGGLSQVYRDGDPDADALRQPVDFYAPDTFNYASLSVSPDGSNLSVNVYGINSYAANAFPAPDQVGPERRILGFQIRSAAGNAPGPDGSHPSFAPTIPTNAATGLSAALSGKQDAFAASRLVLDTYHAGLWLTSARGSQATQVSKEIESSSDLSLASNRQGKRIWSEGIPQEQTNSDGRPLQEDLIGTI